MLYIYTIMLKIEYFDKKSTMDISGQIDWSIAAFEKKYNVFLTIHAMNGFWYKRDLSYLFPKWRYHRAAYCQNERYSRKRYDSFCLRECAAGVEKESLRSGEPFIHCCWKGVKELVVPFLWNDVLELIFYIGPFRGSEPPDEMRKAWELLPEFPSEACDDIIHEIRLLGSSFYSLRLLENRTVKNSVPNRGELIREYILRHSNGDISLEGLAKYLGVSPSRASHLCTAYLGVSFQEQVTNIRLKNAESLLKETNEPIKEIAARAGFANVYYFSRMFRKFFGYPPGTLRRKKSPDFRHDS